MRLPSLLRLLLALSASAPATARGLRARDLARTLRRQPGGEDPKKGEVAVQQGAPFFLHVPYLTPGWATVQDEMRMRAESFGSPKPSAFQPADVAFVFASNREELPSIQQAYDRLGVRYHRLAASYRPWDAWGKVGPLMELLHSGNITEKYVVVSDADDVFLLRSDLAGLAEAFESYRGAAMVLGVQVHDEPRMPEAAAFERKVALRTKVHPRAAMYMARADSLLRLLKGIAAPRPEERADFDDEAAMRRLHMEFYPEVQMDTEARLFDEGAGWWGHPELVARGGGSLLDARPRRELPVAASPAEFKCRWKPAEIKLGRPHFLHVPHRTWNQGAQIEEWSAKMRNISAPSPRFVPENVAFVFASNRNNTPPLLTAYQRLGFHSYVIAQSYRPWNWYAKIGPLIDAVKSGLIQEEYVVMTDADDVFLLTSDFSGLVDAFESYGADMVLGSTDTNWPFDAVVGAFEAAVYPWARSHRYGQSAHMIRTSALVELLEDIPVPTNHLFDDQRELRKLHMRHYPRIKVDTLTKLFVRAQPMKVRESLVADHS